MRSSSLPLARPLAHGSAACARVPALARATLRELRRPDTLTVSAQRRAPSRHAKPGLARPSGCGSSRRFWPQDTTPESDACPALRIVRAQGRGQAHETATQSLASQRGALECLDAVREEPSYRASCCSQAEQPSQANAVRCATGPAHLPSRSAREPSRRTLVTRSLPSCTHLSSPVPPRLRARRDAAECLVRPCEPRAPKGALESPDDAGRAASCARREAQPRALASLPSCLACWEHARASTWTPPTSRRPRGIGHGLTPLGA